MTNIPSEQPGRPSSNLEFLDSLEFLSRMSGCRQSWHLPLLTLHLHPILPRALGACLWLPQPAPPSSTTHRNFSHFWPPFGPRDARISNPTCPWDDGPRKEAHAGPGRGLRGAGKGILGSQVLYVLVGRSHPVGTFSLLPIGKGRTMGGPEQGPLKHRPKVGAPPALVLACTPFSEYLLSTYYRPDPVLGVEDDAVKKTERSVPSRNLDY